MKKTYKSTHHRNGGNDMNIRKELENIRGMIHKAYYQCGVLDSIVTGPNESSPQFSGELDKLAAGLEKTVMQARYLNEACYMDIQPIEKNVMDYEGHWAKNMPAGRVEVDENGWLHIVLDTLLPHCKRGTNPWLRDTLIRLLYGYKQNGGQLPHFERAMLIINEHCDIKSRQVYDNDNKGWKVIPNVLKGLVVDDDNQFSLGVALVSTWDDVPACHIHVMDMADAGTYFSLYLGNSGSYFRR